MPEALKEGDFVELDYTGKVVEDNIVFDTTIEDVAKQNSIHDSNAKYEPVRICLGKRHVIAGLDKNLIGKEIGRKYVFKIPASEAFGDKNPKLIQLVSTGKFRQQNIAPMPGLQVNMDGIMGTIKAVSGGRTIVDFNHPLSGKELEYEVEVRRIITDAKEKVDTILRLLNANLEHEMHGEKLILKSGQELPKEAQESISKAITDSVKEVKAVAFEKKAAAEQNVK